MGAIDSIRYGTRKKECFLIYDSDNGFMERTVPNVKLLVNKWDRIEKFEFSKRKNGKPLSKLILTFPRDWTEEQCKNAIKQFLDFYFKNHQYTFCFHEGKSGKNFNLHGHLYYSERIMTDPKFRKDPKMSKLGFVKKTCHAWLTSCGLDLFKVPDVPRIPMKQWKKNEEEARNKKNQTKNLWESEQNALKKVGKEIQHLDKLFLRIEHSAKRKKPKNRKLNHQEKPEVENEIKYGNQFSLLKQLILDSFEAAKSGKQFVKYLESDDVFVMAESNKYYFGFDEQNIYCADEILVKEDLEQLDKWFTIGNHLKI